MMQEPRSTLYLQLATVEDPVVQALSVLVQFPLKTSFRMSQQPGHTIYSDEASMASGNDSNGVPVVTPQQIEEPETGLVPQEPRPLARDLFGDQRIFVNAP